MRSKHVLWDERVRRVPKQFSWVDHRLVRDGLCRRCEPTALALYLFLITVSDAQGLSYYSQAKIARLINLTSEQVGVARDGLCRAGLLAYEEPIYQVLEIPEVKA